jgi:hypothetical protein
MNARRSNVALAAALAVPAALVLVGCGGLSRELRQEITAEKLSLQSAANQLQHAQQTVRDNIAHSPDLFRESKVKVEWPARLESARGDLTRAQGDLTQLDKLSRDARNQEDDRRARKLLSDERDLRRKVAAEAESVEADSNSWLDFERNLPHYLTAMQREYDAIRAVDLTPVSTAVHKAEQDWPAKKPDLESRLNALTGYSADADKQWTATAAARQNAEAGEATGPEIATLIEANDDLSRASTKLPHEADELRASTGQLYDSWDKVLADLEVSNRGGQKAYSEKVQTVRTHFTDVPAKKTEVSTDTQWVDVPASTYQSVENDLGMTIAHKEAGKFDSEAQNEVQPPGFSYIAPPEVGSNQYGYWSHSGGSSVWNWLPEYLIMRELFWGRHYQPIYINEYNGYQVARRSGQVYYGRETPASPPKYGSHGTFTTERYASSRYVQSGGYAGSGYATSRAPPAVRSEPGFGSPGSSRSNEPESGVGKRFGGSSNGQHFGSSGGSSSGSGQRFGSSRPAPRSTGHAFGKRR